jgi:myosin heavy subunit
MNRLLEDERKAYRTKAEKASVDYKKLEEQYQKKLLEVEEASKAAQRAVEDKSKQQLQDLESKMKKAMEDVKKQEDKKRENLITKGQKMIEEAKTSCAKELQAMHAKQVEVSRSLREQEERSEHLANKNSSLKRKLEYATKQLNSLENNQDDLEEEIEKLKREKHKIEEEKETIKRQLGGRYGTDGQMQNQVDKLMKELGETHQENRELKKKLAARTCSEDLSGSFDLGEGHQPGYSRGGVNTTALAQVRAGYEEEIANLNDEKRELIMKNSAAITDVKKAEQIAWEREQEISQLKNQLTSLQLALQRAEICNESENSFYSQAKDVSFTGYARDASFVGAQDTSFAGDHENSENLSKQRLDGDASFVNDRLQSSSTVPESKRVLTPSRKHANARNDFSEQPGDNNVTPSTHPFAKGHTKPKVNPYELRLQNISENAEPKKQVEDRDSIINAIQAASPMGSEDANPECNQS